MMHTSYGLNGTTLVKYLTQCLAHTTCSIMVAIAVVESSGIVVEGQLEAGHGQSCLTCQFPLHPKNETITSHHTYSYP